jgi:hypothetical protein
VEIPDHSHCAPCVKREQSSKYLFMPGTCRGHETPNESDQAAMHVIKRTTPPGSNQPHFTIQQAKFPLSSRLPASHHPFSTTLFSIVSSSTAGQSKARTSSLSSPQQRRDTSSLFSLSFFLHLQAQSVITQLPFSTSTNLGPPHYYSHPPTNTTTHHA